MKGKDFFIAALKAQKQKEETHKDAERVEKFSPAALYCGFFQVDVTSRKYALEEEVAVKDEKHGTHTYTHKRRRLGGAKLLTFFDFLLSRCPLYQPEGGKEGRGVQ